ncbi:MAG: tetratricopeptide repeat protein [Pyrinomonadaceae bacterium]
MAAPVNHYCQKCLAMNPLGQDYCTRCGTRLMIVVEPAGARFEAGEASVTTAEHLLERISAVEMRTARLTERLERGLDLLLRQAQNAYFDRALVKALIALLTEDGVVEHQRLEKLWSERCEKDAAEQQESVRRDDIRLRILSGYKGAKRYDFEQLINEAFLLIEDNQLDRGIQLLKKASALSGSGYVLSAFLGEHFFRQGKIKPAREQLSRAHDAAPDDARISLLLGLTCADDGELEMAKCLLRRANENGSSTFAAHYGLGRLFVAEGNWPQAICEFKAALHSRPSPEAHYALACLYYQLCRDTLASRHLKKALAMDENYPEAHELLNTIVRRNSRGAVPKKAVGDSSPLVPSPKADSGKASAVAPLFQQTRSRNRLMTGSDKRIAQALREDALASPTKQ